MKIKFINAVLLLAVLGIGCTTFTSCKDTDDDLRTEWSQADADLKLKIDKLSNDLEALKQAQEACRQECQQKIADLLRRMAAAESRLDLDEQKIQQISNQIADILTDINKIKNDLNGKVDADQVKTIVKEVFESYGIDYYTGLGLATQADLDKTNGEITNILTQIANLTTTVNNLQTNYNNLYTLVTNLQNNYNQLIQDLESGKYQGLTKAEVETMIDVAIQTLKNEIKAVTDVLTSDVATLKNDMTTVKNNITALQNDVTTNKNQIAALQTQYQNLEARVAALETAVAEIAQIKADISEIKTRLSVTEQKAIDAYNQAQTNLATLTTLQALIGDCEGLTNLADEIRDLKTKYSDLDSKINSVNSDLIEKINALDSKIDAVNTALGQKITDLEQRVAANEQAIAELKVQVEKLLKLEDRLNSLITSVIVQGTFNPLFGTFSLPIGVQSNMLVNYYGYSEKQTYEFPSVQSVATFDNEVQITEAELRMLEASGYSHETIANGSVLMENRDGNLGTVYVTINPNNVNFAGQNLPLVNSRDEASQVELRNLRPSEALLNFGYSHGRAGNGNGFYEADATLPATMEAIDMTALRIDDNLKSAMKDILKDKRSNLRSNIVGLMRAVYDQCYGILPAYAMKAAWTVNGESYAVYSNYNIAATTFRPLSYSFLYDKSFGKKLPTFDPISETLFEIDAEKYKFDFSDILVKINGDNIKLGITLDDVELSYDGEALKVTVNVKGEVKDDKGNVIGHIDTTTTGNVDDASVDEMLKSIQDQFNKQIGVWNKAIEDAYRTSIQSLMKAVNDDVRRIVDELQGEINHKIDLTIQDIENALDNRIGSHIGQFNSFISRYNSLAGRINNVLENPNHYLQPTMLYQAGEGFHFLSRNVNRPTTFRKAGGNGLMLYATSFTGEVIAPAYKKMIACTNVIDNATGKSAQGGDAQLLEDLKSINGTTYLAEVRPGNQIRYALNAESMKAGRTYEILYTAVDYLGVTSTAHFYLTVAE